MRFLKFGIIMPLIIIFITLIFGVTGAALTVVLWTTFILFILFLFGFLYGAGSNSYKYKSKTSIYDWMDEADNDNEHLLTPLKTTTVYYKTIDNLKILKSTIMRQSNGELESLKLYKAFYIQISKETMEELYFKTALIIISSLAVFIIRDYIAGVSTGNKVIGFVVFFGFLINVAFVSQKIIANKKRIGLLIEVLNICIEEVEEKGEKKLEK